MKNKAVFLDRDGIINMERGEYTYRPEDFVFVEGMIESLQLFQAQGFRLIVISNQSGIAKGIYTLEDVEILHRTLMNHMKENGIVIDEIYYCPHHPDISACICRKPDSLLIEKALARFRISPSLSFFIGDRERDVKAAEKAGVKGILVESNSSLKEVVKEIIELSPNS